MMESRTLTTLRDTLLPKLLSGELDYASCHGPHIAPNWSAAIGELEGIA